MSTRCLVFSSPGDCRPSICSLLIFEGNGVVLSGADPDALEVASSPNMSAHRNSEAQLHALYQHGAVEICVSEIALLNTDSACVSSRCLRVSVETCLQQYHCTCKLQIATCAVVMVFVTSISHAFCGCCVPRLQTQSA